jgi:hypothetical protein
MNAGRKRFGELTIIRSYRTRANNHPMCWCLCSCGRRCRVRETDIRRLHTKSCGHLRRTGHRHSAESRAAIARYAREARKKRMEAQSCPRF